MRESDLYAILETPAMRRQRRRDYRLLLLYVALLGVVMFCLGLVAGRLI